MKEGNWVPMDKEAIRFIPDDRPFSKAEALLSLQVAYDCNQDVSLLRFSKLWKWSIGKVERFMKELGLKITYEGHKFRPKNRKLTVSSREANGKLKFLCNKGKKEVAVSSREANGNRYRY